jgi:hypothetical protein
MDCAMAWSVYALLDEELVEHLSASLCHNAKEVTTVIALWAIWSARHKAIHEEIFLSPFAIFKFIEKCKEDPNQATSSTKPVGFPRSTRPVPSR